MAIYKIFIKFVIQIICALICLCAYQGRVFSTFQRVSADLLSTLNISHLTEITRPEAGLESVLKPDVFWVQNTLKLLRVKDFQMYGTYPSDGEVFQRLEESTWPIRQVAKSHWVVLCERELSDLSSRSCQVQKKRGGLVIAYCKHE
jgi:hypothetical protein